MSLIANLTRLTVTTRIFYCIWQYLWMEPLSSSCIFSIASQSCSLIFKFIDARWMTDKYLAGNILFNYLSFTLPVNICWTSIWTQLWRSPFLTASFGSWIHCVLGLIHIFLTLLTLIYHRDQILHILIRILRLITSIVCRPNISQALIPNHYCILTSTTLGSCNISSCGLTTVTLVENTSCKFFRFHFNIFT